MSKQSCFHPPKLVMKIDNVSYFGASKMGASRFIGDIMVNFTTSPDAPGINDIPVELQKYIVRSFSREIIIPWPDFGLPSVISGFWLALHEYVKDYKKMKKEARVGVCFHCAAGHGRTGTALCAMLITMNKLDPKEAVDYVRSVYCDSAVETEEQCEYLRGLDEYYNGRCIDDEDMPDGSSVNRFNILSASQSYSYNSEEPSYKKNKVPWWEE